MNKLDMAHEHIMKSMEKSRPFASMDDLIKWGWEYADKMQAEEDKRNQDSRSLTKDQEGNCLHFHHEFGHKKCMDCGASLDDAKSQLDKMIHDDGLMLKEQAKIKGINLDDYSFVKPYIP